MTKHTQFCTKRVTKNQEDSTMDKKQDNKKIGHTSMKNDKISFSCNICDSWFIGKSIF